MLKVQKNYRDYVLTVKKSLENLGLNTEKADIVLEAIEQLELIIPIIGAFDAGKSTFINSFLNTDLLPTNVTPETAIPAELRFSESEYLEAIKKDNSSEKHNIEDLNQLSKNAANYRFVRLFLNNKNLKDIEPFIIVDMPGFESPISNHHKTITEYIDKGVHFVVLLNAKAGTINATILKQLDFLKTAGKTFTFLLSKANLLTEESLKEIKEQMEKQLNDFLDIETEIIPIGKDDGNKLKEILVNLDPNKLFSQTLKPIIENFTLETIETLNNYISTFKKDSNKIKNEIKFLTDSIKEIEKKKEEELEKIKEKTSDVDIDEIIEKIETDLTRETDVFVDYLVDNNMHAFEEEVTDIIKSTLLLELGNYIDTRSNQIIENFSSALIELQNNSSYKISPQMLKAITEQTKKLIKNAQKGLNNLTKQLSNIQKAKKIWQTISAILAILTKVLQPVLEVIIVFLPDILSPLIKKWEKSKIRKELITKVFPKLLRKTKVELYQQLKQIETQMVKEIGEFFEQQLKEKQSEIEKASKEMEKKKEKIEEKIKVFEKTQNEITTLANQTLSL